MRDEFDSVIAALVAGDVAELDRLSQCVAGFPGGEDTFIGSPWILHAVGIGSVAAVRWMLERRVELSFRNANGGYTSLHTALERDSDRYEVLELLLAAGASVNEKGINDWTPAHMAAARDDVEALRILIRYGADLTIRTVVDDYATPLEEARILGKQNAVRYLERH